MKLKTVILRNFRCYHEEIRISFRDDITAFIGKNDAGKSTILEALEIFFNGDTIKMEQNDAYVESDCSDVTIGCVFTDLPTELVLDDTSTTTLEAEYLLNEEGDLELHKIWDCTKKNPKEEVVAICQHPSVEGADGLLQLANNQLKTRLKERDIDPSSVDQRVNPQLRSAIWKSFEHDDLQLSTREIPLNKADAKRVWEQLEKILPSFALFQADRPSRDDDDEVQDPMKIAVAEAIRNVEPQLDEIKEQVQEEAAKVAQATLDKLQEMDKQLATDLSPTFREEPKWANLFKLTLIADKGIPLNKRGSGVRRLVLLNFFRAQAEKKYIDDEETSGIIYAIEEPETSQHPANQQLLMEALMALSEREDCQVILSTHVPGLAGLLPVQSLRYIETEPQGVRFISEGTDEVYAIIASELGVLPDNRIRVLVCVEGPNDVSFLRHASHILRKACSSLPDLQDEPSFVLLPLGGSTLKQWVEHRYLEEMRRPEVHIYDRDRGRACKYQSACDKVNARSDGSKAFITEKAELENYLHADAIKEALGVSVSVDDTSDVPRDVARAMHEKSSDTSKPWEDLHDDKQRKKISRAKQRLNNEAVKCMTLKHFSERDPEQEIHKWLRAIASLGGTKLTQPAIISADGAPPENPTSDEEGAHC